MTHVEKARKAAEMLQANGFLVAARRSKLVMVKTITRKGEDCATKLEVSGLKSRRGVEIYFNADGSYESSKYAYQLPHDFDSQFAAM